MRTPALAVLVAVAALAQPGDEDLVIAQLRDGRKLQACTVRTDGKGMLILTRADGMSEPVPLRDVSELRFKNAEAADPKQDGKLWAELRRVRGAPFAGPEFARLLSESRQSGLAERTVALAGRFQRETDPARRLRQALNLAALRFALGDLDGCRQSLRAVKALAREARDWDAYNESCVRLAALQLPAETGAFDPRGSDWRDCKAELQAGILEQDQRADLKARIQAVSRLAGLVK